MAENLQMACWFQDPGWPGTNVLNILILELCYFLKPAITKQDQHWSLVYHPPLVNAADDK
jgi:hypothetical protein